METGAVVLAPDWPIRSKGYGIALRSALFGYRQVFHELHYVGISTDSRWASWTQDGDRESEWRQGVAMHHVEVPGWPALVKYLLGLVRGVPAVAAEYDSDRVRRQLDGVLAEVESSNEKAPVVIYEDLPVSCLMEFVESRLSRCHHVIRSHNVLGEIFEGYGDTRNIIERRLWSREVDRMARYESDRLACADGIWTITSRDATEYSRRYGVDIDGVVGVCLDRENIAEVPEGARDTVVHIGTADRRKGAGLTWFVDDIWPIVKRRRAEAQAIIAGRNTERFERGDYDVRGLGFVQNELDVLAEGRIFINPQRHGSGLQIKSVMAMLSGRTLVSTTTGVEGVGGTEGIHYVVADSTRAMADALVGLMEDPRRARRIGAAGREYAREVFAPHNLVDSVEECVASVRGDN